MTRARILSRVSCPKPLMPTGPTAPPGSTTKSTSRSAQRQPRRPLPVATRLRWPALALNDWRVGSARNRFQICVAAIVPSGDVGKATLHLLEHDVPDHEVQDRGGAAE